MKKSIWIPLMALIAGLALAQPSPPVPPTPPPPPGPGTNAPLFPNPSSHREAERASKELYKLQFELSYTQGPRAALAQRLASEAQRDFQAQRHFQAAERAKAARKILLAQRFESGMFAVSPSGRPRPVSYSAPYRAQERIARLEAELAYYRNNNPLVRQLLQEARGLLSQVNPNDFSSLQRAEAAHHLASAAGDLIKADRGF
ncbi:MAG: hypothetical protein KatS3mg071_0009 [Meiothermus sp.]|nr:MAG: hypothetical protein KatS3mg071_0009 [Meiothermus sp.]